MPQRRVEQKLGLTYDTTPEQMETVVSAIRGLLEKDTGVSNDFLVVQFAGFGESSLDIEIVYFTTDPDYRNHMQLRQRINLGILRLVEAQGLSFAFPTQTVHQASPRRGA
jgi:MscS family membrane protein